MDVKRSIPSLIRGLAATLPLLAVLAGSLAAQDVIPDPPTCARCTISVREVVTLADDPRAHMPGPPMRMAVDGRGRYWLTYSSGNGMPIAYGSDGRLIRELGPEGDGPGEYRRPTIVHPLPGDSTLVYDGGRSSLFVLDADLNVRRAISQAPNVYGLFVLSWPGLVFVKQPGRLVEPMPTHLRSSFQLLDLSGGTPHVIRTFGAGFDWGATGAGRFAVWTWDYNPYRIERWAEAGERTSVIERRPSWFPPEDRPALAPGQRLPGHIQGVTEDASGRLWVFLNEPTAVWQRDAGSPNSAMHNFFRTRVEIIDPARRSLVASVPLEGWVVAPFGGQRAAIYGTTPQGTPYVRIVQLTLVEP